MNFKEEHITQGYFAKITTIAEIRGMIVDFPMNVFNRVPQTRIIYEITDDKLNIYADGKKIESVPCPEYAQRYLIATDITVKMTQRGMDTTLTRAFDSKGNTLSREDDKIGLVDLIRPSKDKEIRRLEYVFHVAITEFMKHRIAANVPAVVWNGFEVVTERYLRGTK